MAELEKCVLLTGSDLGDRVANLAMAARLINHSVGTILQVSDVLESEPWGFESDTLFLNQALLLETELEPIQVLKTAQQIETAIGRQRNRGSWASRVIDIDILCSEVGLHSCARLTVPHRLLHQRAFALRPLCQLVPDWTHPLFHRTYRQLLEALEQSASMTPVLV